MYVTKGFYRESNHRWLIPRHVLFSNAKHSAIHASKIQRLHYQNFLEINSKRIPFHVIPLRIHPVGWTGSQSGVSHPKFVTVNHQSVTGLWTVGVAHLPALSRVGIFKYCFSNLEPCRSSCRHCQCCTCCPNKLRRVVQVDKLFQFLYCAAYECIVVACHLV